MPSIVYTFGTGAFGELGVVGADEPKWRDACVVAFPKDVVGETAVAEALALGTDHSLALVGGSVFRWGLLGAHAVPRPWRGSVGPGAAGPSPEVVPTPVAIAGLAAAAPRSRSPTRSPGVPTRREQAFRAIACGGSNSYMLTTDGEVRLLGGLWPPGGDTCSVRRLWGNARGGPSSRVLQVVAGWRHCLLLTEAGCIFALGDDEHGQCAGVNTGSAAIPVPTEEAIVGIAAGACHSAAWDAAGRAFLWGHGGNGRLGRGRGAGGRVRAEHLRSPAPVASPALREEFVVAVFCGSNFTLFATGGRAAEAPGRAGAPQARALWACGGNRYGQLGIGSTEPSASEEIVLVQLPKPGDELIAVSCGANHTLCLTRPLPAVGAATNDERPTVWSWGCAASGQCGRAEGQREGSPPPDARPKPQALAAFAAPSPSWAVAVAAGRSHSAVLARTGPRAAARVPATLQASPGRGRRAPSAGARASPATPPRPAERRSVSQGRRSPGTPPIVPTALAFGEDDVIGEFLVGLGGSPPKTGAGIAATPMALLLELGEAALHDEEDDNMDAAGEVALPDAGDDDDDDGGENGGPVGGGARAGGRAPVGDGRTRLGAGYGAWMGSSGGRRGAPTARPWGASSGSRAGRPAAGAGRRSNVGPAAGGRHAPVDRRSAAGGRGVASGLPDWLGDSPPSQPPGRRAAAEPHNRRPAPAPARGQALDEWGGVRESLSGLDSLIANIGAVPPPRRAAPPTGEEPWSPGPASASARRSSGKPRLQVPGGAFGRPDSQAGQRPADVPMPGSPWSAGQLDSDAEDSDTEPLDFSHPEDEDGLHAGPRLRRLVGARRPSAAERPRAAPPRLGSPRGLLPELGFGGGGSGALGSLVAAARAASGPPALAVAPPAPPPEAARFGREATPEPPELPQTVELGQPARSAPFALGGESEDDEGLLVPTFGAARPAAALAPPSRPTTPTPPRSPSPEGRASPLAASARSASRPATPQPPRSPAAVSAGGRSTPVSVPAPSAHSASRPPTPTPPISPAPSVGRRSPAEDAAPAPAPPRERSPSASSGEGSGVALAAPVASPPAPSLRIGGGGSDSDSAVDSAAAAALADETSELLAGVGLQGASRRGGSETSRSSSAGSGTARDPDTTQHIEPRSAASSPLQVGGASPAGASSPTSSSFVSPPALPLSASSPVLPKTRGATKDASDSDASGGGGGDDSDDDDDADDSSESPSGSAMAPSPGGADRQRRPAPLEAKPKAAESDAADSSDDDSSDSDANSNADVDSV